MNFYHSAKLKMVKFPRTIPYLILKNSLKLFAKEMQGIADVKAKYIDYSHTGDVKVYPDPALLRNVIN